MVHYHLPGLFEFYEFYKEFLLLYSEHREYFYDWAEISSIYGAPSDCIWGGGRVGYGDNSLDEAVQLVKRYSISPRLTFSNSLVMEEHLSDYKCNNICKVFEKNITDNRVGIIVHSDLLLDYLKRTYPSFYFISSTTKVITDFGLFKEELDNSDFEYVVADFRFNNRFEKLDTLTKTQKRKTELLCNECCELSCMDRAECYKNVSQKSLGINVPDHICTSDINKDGYVFSKAMKSPAFISVDDIRDVYLKKGFTEFKIEGRSLGSAMIMEFLLYYMTKPEFMLNVREAIYLDSSLDLF